MSIRVSKIDPTDLSKAYEIRTQVFVNEQQVPSDLEIDDFEDVSQHYLAYHNHLPVGTARWRNTDLGFKLERFAVLKPFRKKAVGSALLEKILQDVLLVKKPEDTVYLHSQLSAMPLYEKFGFKKVGSEFEECGIKHYKMILLR